MLKLKGLIAVALLALPALLCLPDAAHAQGCGPQNPNCIVPTAPVGTSNNQAASTQFVQQAIGGGTSLPLASGKIYIGSLAGVAAAQTLSGSGDCTVSLSNAGVASFLCTKTNGTSFGALATLNSVGNAQITPGSANTVKGSVNGSTTSDLAIASCSAIYNFTQWLTGTGWQCGINPVLPSRATAATLNLSAFSVVTTQGYGAGGDGGGATFKNIGSAAFSDSQIATGTISNNGASGCTSAAPGVALTGGTGRGAAANVSVGGGVVTNVSLVNNKGNAYTLGDVLSISVAGCAQTPTFTVASVTTATGSFIDNAGTHWQLTVDQNNYANVKQFGAACNWTASAGDAGSTDDTTAITNALNWAGDTVQPTIDAGGVAGRIILFPFGNCLSGALFQPFGTTIRGQNAWSSEIKFTDAMGAAVIPLTICETTTQLACFGSHVENITLRGGSGSANANVPMVFSNSLQQMVMLYRVAFYPGQRGCVQYDHGYGGAAQVGFVEVECTMSSTGNPGFNFTNIGTTEIYLRNVNAEFGGSGVAANGFQATGGFFEINNWHSEGVSTPIFWNNTGGLSAGFLTVQHISGGAHCTQVILKQTGSTANDVYVQDAQPNGCTNTVQNGGTAVPGPIGAFTLF